jgi:hypothetical protein
MPAGLNCGVPETNAHSSGPAHGTGLRHGGSSGREAKYTDRDSLCRPVRARRSGHRCWVVRRVHARGLDLWLRLRRLLRWMAVVNLRLSRSRRGSHRQRGSLLRAAPWHVTEAVPSQEPRARCLMNAGQPCRRNKGIVVRIVVCSCTRSRFSPRSRSGILQTRISCAGPQARIRYSMGKSAGWTRTGRSHFRRLRRSSTRFPDFAQVNGRAVPIGALEDLHGRGVYHVAVRRRHADLASCRCATAGADLCHGWHVARGARARRIT